LFVLLMTSAASAFWSLWPPGPARDDPPTKEVGGLLDDIRSEACGNDADAVRSFGENAFMRREWDSADVSPRLARALAGAHLADRTDVARDLLEPWVTDRDRRGHAAASLALAFAALRRDDADGSGSETAAALLAGNPALRKTADGAYIEAVVALVDGRWVDAGDAAARAINLSPGYYNAQVILSLAKLQGIGRAASTGAKCSALTRSMAMALAPLLRLGACPTHVAHFELTAQRFLPPRSADGRLGSMRRIMLAYVSRNDEMMDVLQETHRKEFGAQGCVGEIEALVPEEGGV